MQIRLDDDLVRPAVVTALCDQIERLDEQDRALVARALRQIAQLRVALERERAAHRRLEGAVYELLCAIDARRVRDANLMALLQSHFGGDRCTMTPRKATDEG